MELPIPEIHRPELADDPGFSPDPGRVADAAASWRERHHLSPASHDGPGIHLLVVDCQLDFSFPEGSLFVAGRSGRGAMDANRSLAGFIYRNLHLITEVHCTLDSHLPHQIFFPSFFVNRRGDHPSANTPVTAQDLRSGRLKPAPQVAALLGLELEWLERHCLHYCETLEAQGKQQLFLWPYHVLLGTGGHRLAGAVDQARLFHAFCRGAANRPVLKGDNPLSERYSVFGEEVTQGFDGRPIPGAVAQDRLLDRLLEAEAVLVAGLASSHCVRASLEDLFGAIEERRPVLAGRVALLDDCTAPVVIPDGPDFTDDAEDAMQALADRGLARFDSNRALDSWLSTLEKAEGS